MRPGGGANRVSLLGTAARCCFRRAWPRELFGFGAWGFHGSNSSMESSFTASQLCRVETTRRLRVDQITAFPTKDIHLARKRTFLKRRLHHPAQPREPAPQVRHSCDDPNPCPRRQPDHRSRCSSTIRSASPSTLPVTQTCPLGNSAWIVPATAEVSCRRSDRFTLLACASLTCTGSNLAGSVFL